MQFHKERQTDRQTDGRTDGQTDRQTDESSHALVSFIFLCLLMFMSTFYPLAVVMRQSAFSLLSFFVSFCDPFLSVHLSFFLSFLHSACFPPMGI